jgi:hypothetical protein
MLHALFAQDALGGSKSLEVCPRKSPYATWIPSQTLGWNWAKLHPSVTKHLRVNGAR